MANAFDMDRPILTFPSHPTPTHWTIRNAVEGVQIFGGIGSGKTSGSGAKLAGKFLEAGFGGLVLTVKPDERELWEKYCAEAGRSDDLIVISPSGQNYFNILDYEIDIAKDSQAKSDNIVEVLKTVIRASEEKDGGRSDQFWDAALHMLLTSLVDLCLIAYDTVTVQMLYDLMQGIPKEYDANPLVTDFTKIAQNAEQRKSD